MTTKLKYDSSLWKKIIPYMDSPVALLFSHAGDFCAEVTTKNGQVMFPIAPRIDSLGRKLKNKDRARFIVDTAGRVRCYRHKPLKMSKKLLKKLSELIRIHASEEFY